MARHGKRYRALYEQVDREREYAPNEAIALIKRMQTAKFAETVECHMRTGLNVRHADEQLRGTIAFPHGLGKDMTIAVFAKGDKAREATEAGADHVGAGLLGLARLVALGEDRYGDVPAEPVGQGDRPAQLLVGVADVEPGANVGLHRLRELRRLDLLDQPDRLGWRVLALAVDLG